VGLAEATLGTLEGRSVLVVGAGGMGALAARVLRERGVGRLRILNRSLERAARLASRLGGEAAGLEALAAAIGQADLVVASTGAAGTVIGPDSVEQALARRTGSSALFLLDLAVPRDVATEVRSLPGVVVADIDDLKIALHGEGAPIPELQRARAIVGAEVARLAQWRRASRLAPLIEALKDRGTRVQAAELARIAPRLSHLSDREWAAVEQLAEGIVAKLLHEPIVRVKSRSEAAGGEALARAMADLFGLDPGPSD
jgi:glutamyl-tRNA reductase